MWARRGSRPVRPLQNEYEWVYLYGAVNPLTGESCALVLPWANTESHAYLSFVEQPAIALCEPLNCKAGITCWYKGTQNSVSMKVRLPGVDSQTQVYFFWLVVGRVK